MSDDSWVRPRRAGSGGSSTLLCVDPGDSYNNALRKARNDETSTARPAVTAMTGTPDRRRGGGVARGARRAAARLGSGRRGSWRRGRGRRRRCGSGSGRVDVGAGVGVGDGEGEGVGLGVTSGVGRGVGAGVGLGVATWTCGAGVAVAVGVAVGDGVATAIATCLGAGGGTRPTCWAKPGTKFEAAHTPPTAMIATTKTVATNVPVVRTVPRRICVHRSASQFRCSWRRRRSSSEASRTRSSKSGVGGTSGSEVRSPIKRVTLPRRAAQAGQVRTWSASDAASGAERPSVT